MYIPLCIECQKRACLYAFTELFHWCKKRGLTSNDISSAPAITTVPKPQQREARSYESRSFGSHHTQAHASKIADQSLAKEKRIAFEVKPYQEAVFLSKLCSSIADKRLFMNRSKVCEETAANQDSNRDKPVDTRLSLTSSHQPRRTVKSSSEIFKANVENSFTHQDSTTAYKPMEDQDYKYEDGFSSLNGQRKICDGRISAGNITEKQYLERSSEIKYENLRYRNVQK